MPINHGGQCNDYTGNDQKLNTSFSRSVCQTTMSMANCLLLHPLVDQKTSKLQGKNSWSISPVPVVHPWLEADQQLPRVTHRWVPMVGSVQVHSADSHHLNVALHNVGLGTLVGTPSQRHVAQLSLGQWFFRTQGCGWIQLL